ncbi:hypothetical protein [Eisenbergiella sp.]
MIRLSGKPGPAGREEDETKKPLDFFPVLGYRIENAGGFHMAGIMNEGVPKGFWGIFFMP